MKALRIAAVELVGMFVDDGHLAMVIGALIAMVALLVKMAHLPPLLGALLLLGGCMVILAESAYRESRRR